jgi:DNA-binding protein YbaB
MTPDSPQQQSSSSASGISSQVSACYDAEKSCIRLLGGESLLEGSIIEMEQSQQFAGTFLVGEVMEIVIMGDNMVPMAVHNEKVKRTQPAATDVARNNDGGSLVENRSLNSHPKKYVYDELRRAEIQSLMKDKTIGREEKLRRMAEIKAKYDDQHSSVASPSRESLQSSSPVNKLNRTAVANNVATNTVTPSMTTQISDKHTQITMHQPITSDPTDPQTVIVPESSSPSSPKADVGRVRFAADSANTAARSSTTKAQPETSAHRRASNRWNHAAVAAVTTNTFAQGFTTAQMNVNQEDVEDYPPPSSKVDDGRVQATTIAADLANTASRRGSMEKAQSEASGLTSHRRASNLWNRAAVAAVTTNTFTQSFPTAQTNVNQEDVDDIIEHLRLNNPALKTLILDGRRFDASWERLFDSIEENIFLTKLSVVDCGLNDATVSALVLALVENETLISIDLSHNEELTDETGLGLLKVIKQGNAFVKKINIEGTSISPEVAEKIQDILNERDDSLKLAKMQKAREAKIKALLSVTASDQVRRNRQSTRRLSSRDDSDDDDEDDGGARIPTTKTGSQRSLYSTESKKSGQSSESGDSGLGRRRNKTVPKGSPSNKLKAAERANMAALQMADLGRSMAHVGKDVSQEIELRKQRGECVHCGQKCFTKSMFKTIPLTIPNKVQEGRCLRCEQLRGSLIEM